jgi:hypothetical protein
MTASSARQLNDQSSSHGDPVSVVGLRRDLGISRERMARLLDVSSRTVARWEERDLLPVNRWVRQVLIQIRNIVELGHESLTDEGLRALMNSPQPVFGNLTGIEMIERGEAEAVYRELAGMAEGYTGS